MLRQTVSTGDMRSHMLACSFALSVLFGSVSVVNTLDLSFTYFFPRRIQVTIIEPRVDFLVWAISVMIPPFLAGFSKGDERWRLIQCGLVGLEIVLVMLNPSRLVVYAFLAIAVVSLTSVALDSMAIVGQSTKTLVKRILIYLLAFLLVIEVSSGTHYVLQSFDRVTTVGRVDAEIELQLSYMSYSVLPWLYVAFLFSWAWVPIVWRQLRKTDFFQSDLSNALIDRSGVFSTSSLRSARERLSTLLDHRLFAAIALAIFIGYYPYFQNPSWLVGTDAYWRYYDPLLRMNVKGVAGGFFQALLERHPFSLALLYAAQLFFNTTAFNVVRLTPSFLVVALALATWYFLAKKKTERFGMLAVTLSILSVTTAVGMYASILANWMALVVWVFFYAYVASRGEKGFGILDATTLLVMSTLILFIHPWTWGVFAASVVVLGLVTIFHDRRKGLKSGVVLIGIVSIGAFLAFLSMILLEGSQGWRVSETLDLYTAVIRDPSSLLLFWDALTRLTQIWAPFFNPLYVAVSILGVVHLQMSRSTPWIRRILIVWLWTAAIGSVLVAPIGFDPTSPTQSESALWRLLFLTPFQLTAPFGVTLITESIRKRWTSGESARASASGLRDKLASIRGVLLAGLFAVGFLLAWVPVEGRALLLLVVVPLAVGFALARADGRAKEILSDIILAGFVLVTFNCATRSLAQLLIDPHNYRPQ